MTKLEHSLRVLIHNWRIEASLTRCEDKGNALLQCAADLDFILQPEPQDHRHDLLKAWDEAQPI